MCGVDENVLTKCAVVDEIKNIEVHLIEQIEEGGYDVEGKLYCGEKYWKSQLLTLSHGINKTWNWYITSGKGY